MKRKKDKKKKKNKIVTMSMPTTSLFENNKGLLLQNGDVIVEEPEEEELADNKEDFSDNDSINDVENMSLSSLNKRISINSGANQTVAQKICSKIMNELVDIVTHSIAE